MFVDEYLTDRNGTAAARRCKYQNPSQDGSRLLNDPRIQAAIREKLEKVAADHHANGSEFILSRLWDVATADPRDLIEIYRIPCRYCWGINGQYQFTTGELDKLEKAYQYGVSNKPYEALWPHGKADYAYWTAGVNKLGFDQQGGDGYTTRRDPNPECRECHGQGNLTHHITDTRKLSPQARQLYRGAKIGKNGIEIVVANQDEARNLLARHYSVGVERKQLVVEHIDPRQLSDDELIRAIADAESTILELKAQEVTITEVSNQRAVAIRRTRQVQAARMRAARNGGQPMVKRPRG
jgi:phage terminase small subunit